MSSTPLPPLTHFDRLWLAEAIRLTEGHTGHLEDAEANRRARAAGGDLRRRILLRAEWLAARDGLRSALVRWRHSAALLSLGLALFALVSGAALAFAAMGQGGRTVNIFWALGSLLGLHLLSLLAWLASLASRPGAGALGRLWLWGSAKAAQDAGAARLASALMSLLGPAGLARWGFGLLVHGFWLLVLTSAFASLLVLLSARRYGFNWETTLLSADSFVVLTRLLGALPSLLGFPLPDAETIRASGETALEQAAARRAWAGWLLGALLVYGVLPRLLLAAVCFWRWRRGIAALTVDLSLPEYVVLRERLLPGSETLPVSDAAPASATDISPLGSVIDGAGAVLVAVELDDRQPWPPALPVNIADAGAVNSRQQRQQLLEQLSRHPPARLAIACDPQRSVDRGTLKLIAELARLAGETRVWLVAAPDDATVDGERLEEWRAAIGRLRLQVVDAAPLCWLESGRD